MKTLKLGDITADVLFKDIKNVHLSVYPPTGRVRISAPERMNLETVRTYAISKLQWIRKHQKKQNDQVRESPRDYITNESHYYLGKRYLLKVVEHNAPPKVQLNHSRLELYVRPDADIEKKKAIMDEWYRNTLKGVIPPYIAKWEKVMRVTVNDFGIKKMKTKWGTCNIRAKRIWLNLKLAKKPIHCLEYVVVHEMVHLLERKHDERYVHYMDKFLPDWRKLKKELGSLPLECI
jgi:predicted metal-dependent hydrolase